MRTAWICLLVLVMVAAISLSTGGCSKSDDAEVMPPPTPVAPPLSSDSEEPESQAGMVSPSGESAPVGESEAAEAATASTELPASLEAAMDGVIGPSARALQAALEAGDLETAIAEAVSIRDVAAAAPTLEGAPTDQAELDEFTGYSDDMVADANAVIDAAEAGDSAKAAEAGALLKESCKACHDVFRKE